MPAAWESQRLDPDDRTAWERGARRLQGGAPPMDNGTLIALSRQIALGRELDVIANNIANLDTTGFKSDGAVFQEYLMPVANAGAFQGGDRRLSYVQDRAGYHNFAAGPLRQTGNPLDVAIDGDAFLVVQTARGERYTRNGALQINAQGELVTSAGDRVVGDGGPIQFQSTDHDISISKSGAISVAEGSNTKSDSARGKLRLVRFDNAQRLQKDGSSLFAAPNGVAPQPAPTSQVVPGAIEQSNVRAVTEMARMIEVTRTYTQVANMIQLQGDRNTLTRLAEMPA
jgi:flagellar basal-body rod protein FlgF